jgi:single-strand DNA-binding protein
VWGKTGENCAQYLDKGREVYIEGRIQTRSWDDKDTGQKRYMTEIVANNVQFLGGKGGDGESRPNTTRTPSAQSPATSGETPPYTDDDIPF